MRCNARGNSKIERRGQGNMRMRTIGFGALVGGLLTAPMMALMYFADKWIDLSFTPFDVFDWIARVLPGPVVTFGIDLMIDALILTGASVADTAKTAEQAMGLLLFFFGGVIATAAVFLIARARSIGGVYGGFLIGAALGVPFAVITANIGQSSLPIGYSFLWTLALFAAWGMIAVVSARVLILAPRPSDADSAADYDVLDAPEPPSATVLDRRRFLVSMGVATATITVAGAGLGRVLAAGERREQAADLAAARAQMPESAGTMIDLPNENDPVKPALGTRPEYTAVRDHYKVFIRSEPTVIDEAGWTLPITGLVDNPQTLTLTNIMERYDPRSEFVTLTCISNRLGGSLISTTYWTGASLKSILADASPRADATHLDITCGDGFHETVALDLIESDPRVMLAYAWDGRPIPFDHGFPLRIWIPDRYGMKQPKWITGIEVVGDEGYREGYWVQRNWDKVARVRTTSVVDTVAVEEAFERDGQQHVPIGGIAFSGVRGVSKVEVRVDNGDWQEAQLRSPLSEASWVIWRYDWRFEPGNHAFEVRCVEADGTPQIEERNSPRPSGATGIHQKAQIVELNDEDGASA